MALRTLGLLFISCASLFSCASAKPRPNGSDEKGAPGRIVCEAVFVFDKELGTGQRKLLESLSKGASVSIEVETATEKEFRVVTSNKRVGYVPKQCVAAAPPVPSTPDAADRPDKQVAGTEPSVLELRAENKFPSFYVDELKKRKELPHWANYACFDTNPIMNSSYFILVAYNSGPLPENLRKFGVVKGVTYQEYLGSTLLNKFPTAEEAMDEFKASKVSLKALDLLNAQIQALMNIKNTLRAQASAAKAGEDVPGYDAFLEKVGPIALYIAHKYLNGPVTPPTQPFDDTDEMGIILYESEVGEGLFSSVQVADMSSGFSSFLKMQEQGSSLKFAFYATAYGKPSLPVSGDCVTIR